MLCNFRIGDEFRLLPYAPHQVGAVVPELPPTIDQTFVTLESGDRASRLHFFDDEAIGDRPSSGDLVQTAISNIQRPSTDAIERRARDVVTGDVRTEQAI